MNRIALIALALLLPGCSLVLPSGSSCSNRMSTYASCAPTQAAASQRPSTLDDTWWKLVRLGDQPVRDGLLLREAHLRLDSNLMRFSGSGGCNQLTGSYSLSGADGIRFGDVAGTRMACQGMELEQGFMKSLEQTVRWRIEDERLQLLDSKGAQLAILQATTANK